MLRRILPTRITPFRTSLYSTTAEIPFDKKPFPFSRFEPCCPDSAAQKSENGFIPCQHHPMPAVLGKKIELKEPMTRPASLRHILANVGPDAIEWTRAKVEAVPNGIIATMNDYENQWIRNNRTRQKKEDEHDIDRLILKTISDKSPSSSEGEIMLFPEFKLVPSSSLFNILDHIWQNPNKALQAEELQDIKADTIILICNHARRDLRCGRLGPLVIDEFNRIIQEKGLSDKVECHGTSHFGGKVKRARH